MELNPFCISQAEIEAFCRRWRLKELALFGSVLRPDFHLDSDVDILITLMPGNHLTLDNRIAMIDELEHPNGKIFVLPDHGK